MRRSSGPSLLTLLIGWVTLMATSSGYGAERYEDAIDIDVPAGGQRSLLVTMRFEGEIAREDNGLPMFDATLDDAFLVDCSGRSRWESASSPFPLALPIEQRFAIDLDACDAGHGFTLRWSRDGGERIEGELIVNAPAAPVAGTLLLHTDHGVMQEFGEGPPGIRELIVEAP